MHTEHYVKEFMVKPGSKVWLKKDFDPGYHADYVKKQDAAEKLAEGVQRLAQYQDRLYAENVHALLIIFQALDAAGKDSVIKHVLSGINPQGCQVFSFKAPSTEELDHGYMWRNFKALPERGRIGIFNRSYYEEVLVVRVHPEILAAQQLPPDTTGDNIWGRRFVEINNFEKYLVNNGIHVLKFFLNVSKEEQKQRFLERIERPEKNWKFSLQDVKERGHWDEYMHAYEEVFNHTSTKWAPWYIVPADRKWFTRLAVANIIAAKMEELNPQYPVVTDQHREELLQAKAALESED